MTEPNHPATLYRAQDQIAKIAGAESYSAVGLLGVASEKGFQSTLSQLQSS